MKRSFITALILLLSINILASEKLNLASIFTGGKVLFSDPAKDSLALNKLIDGVVGSGGLVVTVSPSSVGTIMLELGGKSVNKVEEVIITAKVPVWQSNEACEIKIWTAVKQEGPFMEASNLYLAYSGVLGTVFEQQNAKYILFEIISHSKNQENIVIEEVEVNGVPFLDHDLINERTVTEDKINLFDHLGMEVSWSITGFQVVTPKPYLTVDGYDKIDVQTSDITVTFNADGSLSRGINLSGEVSIPKGWEKLFLPETVYMRCYFQDKDKEWLVGSKTIFLNELTNKVELTLSLAKNRSWPQGKYRLELFVNEALPLSQYFWIEEEKKNVNSSVVSTGGSN